jgi:hypothetical protein
MRTKVVVTLNGMETREMGKLAGLIKKDFIEGGLPSKEEREEFASLIDRAGILLMRAFQCQVEGGESNG